MDTLEKVLDYLDDELKQFKFFINRQTAAPSIPSRKDELDLIERARKSTLDRGMGVVMFVQSLGIKFDNVKSPYDEFKNAVNQLAEVGKRGIDL